MRWGEEALGEDDPQVRAAGREILAMLRLSWRRAWVTWHGVFDALAGDIRAAGAAAQASGKNVPDRLLSEFMERWEDRLAGPEEPRIERTRKKGAPEPGAPRTVTGPKSITTR